MARNDNSVNMTGPKPRYHHGDLRAALVRIGLDHLARAPETPLSLREIAREAGVSPTAVYRHFPDKRALEQALCAAGSEMLGIEQARAMREAGGGRAGFDATGRAYVRFALAHPALFRLISASSPAVDFFEGPADRQSSAIRGLRERISAMSADDVDDTVLRVRAIQAWAMVHGLACLMLDGQVPPDDALIEQVILGRTDDVEWLIKP